MLAIISVITPIFALMALGYGAVRFKLFPAEGIKSLIAFVNNFATPCLLFHSILTSDFRSAFNIGIIGPFYLGALICFVIGIVIAIKVFGNTPGRQGLHRLCRHLHQYGADRPADHAARLWS